MRTWIAPRRWRLSPPRPDCRLSTATWSSRISGSNSSARGPPRLPRRGTRHRALLARATGRQVCGWLRALPGRVWGRSARRHAIRSAPPGATVTTFQERVDAVEAFAVTTRQASFLTLVALHSGYRLRRQYAAFAGVRYGKNVRDFLDSLVTRQPATRFTIRADRGHRWRPRRSWPRWPVNGQCVSRAFDLATPSLEQCRLDRVERQPGFEPWPKAA